MKVILKEDLKKTGKKGDVVNVSDGYARNMLIPKGIATEATEENLRRLNKEKAEMEAKNLADKEAAEDKAKKLAEKEVKIVAKRGDGDRLFGSITTMEIVDELKKQTGIEIDKKKIVLDTPIKEIGEYELKVKLHTGVKGTIKVVVEGE